MVEKALPYKYQVYNEIKTGILRGQYPPGDVLNERRLSAEMGISRTPVREAMQMLEHDGWLVTETYKGSVVRELDLKYVKEVQKIRKALEVLAVEDAVLLASGADLRELAKLAERQEELLRENDSYEFIAQDRRFHQKIYAMSGNETLCGLLNNYSDMLSFFGMQAIKQERRSRAAMEEHWEIVRAMQAGDREAAVNAMSCHMRETYRSIEAWKLRDRASKESEQSGR